MRAGLAPRLHLISAVIAAGLTHAAGLACGEARAQDLPSVQYPRRPELILGDRPLPPPHGGTYAQADRLPLARFGSLRSPASVDPAIIFFVNETNAHLQVFWIDFEGRSRPYGPLEPRQRRGFNVNIGRLWFVGWNAAHPVAIFRVNQARCEAIVR